MDAGGKIGHVIPYEEDNRQLVVSVESNLYKLDIDSKVQTLLTEIVGNNSPGTSRINDGKCDARGRLWTGEQKCLQRLQSLTFLTPILGKDHLDLRNSFSVTQETNKTNFKTVFKFKDLHACQPCFCLLKQAYGDESQQAH